MSMNPYKSILLLRFLRISYSSMSWSCSGMLKSRSVVDVVFIIWKSIISLFKGHPSWFQRLLNSKTLKRDFQLPTIMSVQSNVSFSRCLYWYATFNSCKYLKSETHLRNSQVNKASSVNQGMDKVCLVVDMVWKNWSWIVVAGYGLLQAPLFNLY